MHGLSCRDDGVEAQADSGERLLPRVEAVLSTDDSRQGFAPNGGVLQRTQVSGMPSSPCVAMADLLYNAARPHDKSLRDFVEVGVAHPGYANDYPTCVCFISIDDQKVREYACCCYSKLADRGSATSFSTVGEVRNAFLQNLCGQLLVCGSVRAEDLNDVAHVQ